MMEYAQADCAQNGIAGVYSSKAMPALGQRPPTTFSQIEESASELAELNKRLSAALDRLGNCVETCENAAGVPTISRVGPDYSRSLNRLRSEISDMRSNISSLETHV